MAMRLIRGWSNPGGFPATEHGLRHLHRNRHANGLAPAFAKVQGRVLVDPERLEALIAAQAERSTSAA